MSPPRKDKIAGMQLETLARDCLYVNWALPRESAPELPKPLRYEIHQGGEGEWVFVSVLLFRLSGLHLASLPFARVSYPQMNLRLYVLDEKGMPSVLFLRTLVPFWVAPMSRLLGRQGVHAASFDYPCPSQSPGEGVWRWTIERRRRLELRGRLASPQTGRPPQMGGWEQTVEYFRNRRRGYVVWDNRLRSIRTSNAAVPIWPIEIEVGNAGLIAADLPDVDSEIWRSPHSAWLCPEIPFHFELGKIIALPLPASRRVPAAEGLSPSS